MSDLVTLSKQDNIGVVTIDNPPVNALAVGVRKGILDCVSAANSDDDIQAIVLICDGRTFIAGADITEFGKPPQAPGLMEPLDAIEGGTKPVIAAIHGTALGGGLEVALACDIRIASESAQFGLPETVLGIIPGWGATQRTARLVGTAKTKEMIFTGRRIKADEALSMGLVNQVVPDEELLDTVLEMAAAMCRQGQTALRHAKTVINRGIDVNLDQALRLEIDTFADLFDTDDRREGMKAFLEKRKPNFTG